jgi:hypothetical protein
MVGCLECYLFDVSAAGWLHGLPLAVWNVRTERGDYHMIYYGKVCTAQ